MGDDFEATRMRIMLQLSAIYYYAMSMLLLSAFPLRTSLRSGLRLTPLHFAAPSVTIFPFAWRHADISGRSPFDYRPCSPAAVRVSRCYHDFRADVTPA